MVSPIRIPGSEMETSFCGVPAYYRFVGYFLRCSPVSAISKKTYETVFPSELEMRILYDFIWFYTIISNLRMESTCWYPFHIKLHIRLDNPSIVKNGRYHEPIPISFEYYSDWPLLLIFFFPQPWEMSSDFKSNPYIECTWMSEHKRRLTAKGLIPASSYSFFPFIVETHLFSVYPLVCTQENNRLSSMCHYCFKRYKTLSRCSRCKVTRYCSKECQVSDW